MLGQLWDRRALLLCFEDELVVNVGDVDDQRHLVTEISQVTLDCIENHGADHMADMARLVHRWAADIHAHLARLDCLGRLPLPSQRVVNLQWHTYLTSSLFGNQDNRLTTDGFRSTDCPDAFTRLGFDVYLAWIKGE